MIFIVRRQGNVLRGYHPQLPKDVLAEISKTFDGRNVVGIEKVLNHIIGNAPMRIAQKAALFARKFSFNVDFSGLARKRP